MAAICETDLYPAIKSHLEKQGYEVKAEVCSCDVMAVRGDEDPVIVELKTGFTLPLVLQGVDRLALSDAVYLAFGVATPQARNSLWRRNRREIKKLCRRLGLGLMTVVFAKNGRPLVEVHLDPVPYRPRKNTRRRTLLLREFDRRVGDPNCGGATRRKIITAYRQDALRLLAFMDENGASKLSVLRAETGVERAAGILQANHYGWFERVARGVYDLSGKGRKALAVYDDALHDLAVAG